MASADDGPAGPEGVPPEMFHEIYEGDPLWEVGRPQPEVERLLAAGLLRGPVLDLGCGTGENSILMAREGLAVVGIDPVPKAIAQARDKARQRAVEGADFEVGSALELPFEAARFQTVLDTAVFHIFSDDDRSRYRDSVARCLRVGGSLFVLCFTEHEPGGGPRRVTQRELRECFAAPRFDVREIRGARYELRGGEADAWLMHAVRT